MDAENGTPTLLADILLERSPINCDFDTMKEIIIKLHSRRKVDENEVAGVLGMMARTASHFESRFQEYPAPRRSWNVEGLVKIVASLHVGREFDWSAVYSALDFEGFFVPDAYGAEMLVRAFKFTGKDMKSFPIHSFLSKQWKNAHGQISFIRNAMLLPAEVFNFSWFHIRKVITLEDIHSATGTAKNTLSILFSQSWNCFELLDLISRLVDSEYFDDVRPIFELASRQSPEILCIALAIMNVMNFLIQPPWNSLLKDILVKLVCGFLLGMAASSIVLSRVWQNNPNVLLSSMVECHRRDASCLSRLLDVAQELKILSTVLDSKPYTFAIDMAALASRREHLNMEKWLLDSIKEKKDIFIRTCLEYLAEKFSNKGDKSVPLSPEITNVFLSSLASNTQLMSAENFAFLRELQIRIASENAKLPQNDGMEASFPPDIEEEAKLFYERIYTQECSAKDVMSIFFKLKESSNPRDQQIFNCMIHNLFDEYRFFAKYPDRELGITAIIFGGLIQNQLISYAPLGVALRCVLESLKKPVGTKLFKFGLACLMHFQGRLPEWPQYCVHLMQIPTLSQFCPELYANLKALLSKSSEKLDMKYPNYNPAEDKLKSEISKAEASLNSLNINTLLDASILVEYPVPIDQTQDKIYFILNNVSADNLESKARDLLVHLSEEFYPWFSKYLVIKRATIEPNNHAMYVSILDFMKSDKLHLIILNETIENVQVLLKSDKILASSSERTLLKNLGTWLGCITLGRNKPILQRHLDLKELLIKGYESNRLIAVIPFVCKVMEQASKSKIFRPYNPWLMAVLRFLVELYQTADLKLNLKFEVEVLCKNLSLEIKEIQPTTLLRSRPRKDPSSVYLPSVPPVSNEPSSDDKLSSLSSLIVLSQNLPGIVFNPLVKKIIVLATEFAIREVSGTVVERSVMISGLTTKEIVCKDFLKETDDSKYKRAASQMMQNLTGGLALVTSLEPMKSAIAGNITLFLQIAGLQSVLSETIIHQIAEDNLEVACSFVERSALAKAHLEAEEMIVNGMSQRRRGHEFQNPSNIPSNLYLSSTANVNQLKVYEDFVRGSRHSNFSSAPSLLIKPVSAAEYEQLAAGLRSLSSEATDSSSADYFSFQQCIDKFLQLISSLEKILAKFSDMPFSSFGSGHELRSIMKKIILLTINSTRKDEISLIFCQKIVQMLYKTQSNLEIEVCIILLMKICEVSTKAAKEVIAWIIYADDDRKFNAPVTCALLTSGLIGLIEYDSQLSKYIDGKRELAVDFAVSLVRLCVLSEVPISTAYDFICTIDSLSKFLAANSSCQTPLTEKVSLLLKDISFKMHLSPEIKDSKDPIVFFFNDWIRLSQFPSTTEKLCATFVGQLIQQGIMKSKDSLKLFFKVCLELSIDMYIKYKRIPSIICYQSIDAIAKLIYSLFRNYSGNDQHAALSDLWICFLEVVGELISEFISKQNYFLQKPVARLLFSALEELSVLEKEDAVLHTQIILAFNNFLTALNPETAPSFVFAWVELMANPFFFPKMLNLPQNAGWKPYANHLSCLFKFIYPFLKGGELSDAMCILYRGVLRVLLVLLHDFPDFLAAFHLQLTHYIAPNCIQMRNLVLSAFPKYMKLPDPFTPNLKVDLLPEIANAPLVMSEYLGHLSAGNLKQKIDDFLRNASPKSFLLELKQLILHHEFVLEAVIMYVGSNGAHESVHKSASSYLAKTPHMELFLFLVNELDNEIRYSLINSICNHLRFPNSHTHYFSWVILCIFSEAQVGFVQEQITRVLLERLIVNRPHPWGLLITFIELIKNPQYGFWNNEFTKISPDIEKLFDSVAKSCMINQKAPE